jgi:hypothetical protein
MHTLEKGKRSNPSLESACQAWRQFLTNYVRDPAHWRERLEAARTEYTKRLPGMRLAIHRLCVNHSLPCMVLAERCDCCGRDGPKMPSAVLDEGSADGTIRLTPLEQRLYMRVPTELWN